LKTQDAFAQVLHPADPDNISHDFWKQTCQTEQSAGLVSVIFKAEYDLAAIRRFCDHLNLFKLGFSWGGPVSLAMLYDLKEMRHTDHAHLKQGLLVRFCIGLEDADDLIQDIENALKAL
ncbi:MAG: PLP-dependent transferase, partial [Acinetobacter sp.]